MTLLKTETDIITGIPTSSIGQAAMLVLMYVDTFKTDVAVSSDSRRHNMTSD